MARFLLRSIVALVVSAVVLQPAVTAGADGVAWQPPVDAPVVDPFRAPEHRWSAGNRGLEYGTVRGQEVRAVADGRVDFAGLVAGDRFVTVSHGDGLRSTYAYLAGTEVVRGQRVSTGQRLGTAEVGFHLTARLGDVYVDPALLLAGGEVALRLVEGPAPPVVRPRHPGLAGAVVAAGRLRPSELAGRAARAVDDWHHLECTPDEVGVPPSAGDRVLVQIGGLGTSSDGSSMAAFPGAALGYDADDTVAFSYAGGCTDPFGFPPGRSALAAELGGTPYGPEHTFASLEASAARLADLVERVAHARPGEPIDLVGHSLGGVVARLAVDELARRGTLGSLDVVMTLGSPHLDPPLATAAVASDGGDLGVLVDDHLPHGGDERSAISTGQLSGVDGLDLPPPSPPPDGVTAVAVAAAGDVVVPAVEARWPGATNVLVAEDDLDLVEAHGELPARPEAARALALARAGLAPACVGLAEVGGSAVLGSGIAAAENLAAVAIGLDGWLG